MIIRRLLPTLIVFAALSAPAALADSGSGSGSGSGSAVIIVTTGSGSDGSGSGSGSATTPAPTPAPTETLPSEEATIKSIAKAISTKDWFLLAGAIMALLIYFVRYALMKKWPKWGESHYGVFIAAGMAGITALAVAWTSGGDVVSSHTLMGALKLLAAATAAYVLPLKLSQGVKAPEA